jgi:hypothetical protein
MSTKHGPTAFHSVVKNAIHDKYQRDINLNAPETAKITGETANKSPWQPRQFRRPRAASPTEWS